MSAAGIYDSGMDGIYNLVTKQPGPSGALPLTEADMASMSSGDLFGWTQNVGMGMGPSHFGKKEFLILSTQGGLRDRDGTPIALGYHTGHWEVGLLVEAAARQLTEAGAIPFAAACSDPCDGRTNGTDGMMDSLAYRNDAAIVLRRLIRSLPKRRGVMGIATCDKGLPAMMMALAGSSNLPGILVPGGVTLLSEDGEDAGKVQTLGARYARAEIDLETVSHLACKACGSPGGGCQFMGTAATSQVVAEALGIALPHSALSPSGSEIWLDMARRSGIALMAMEAAGLRLANILSDEAVENAMILHAAVGGSTNLVLHLPAIAHAAGLKRPTVEDWHSINRKVPRLVDVLPNGPNGFATVQVFLAGGVPEIMLHLRDMGLLNLDVQTVTGATLGENLDWWEQSDRRIRLKAKLQQLDAVDPAIVIMDPATASNHGLTGTVTFLKGNLAPEGALIKSTAIDPSRLDRDGVFSHAGPVKVFTSGESAIAAVKNGNLMPYDIMVLMGIGPGAGMPETYQVTSALRHLKDSSTITLITDGRFSGVSTGACIGHVSPEAWAGGPISKLRDGDQVSVRIDTRNMEGELDVLCMEPDAFLHRYSHPGLVPNPNLPDDTRLWAALQNVSGGSWGGCVYDVDSILKKLL